MSKVKQLKHHQQQQGNILLLTAILILILSIIVATCLNLSSVQLKVSDLSRNTSNTYYLAQDGIEKQVDTINKALEAKLPVMVQEVGKPYIDALTGGGTDYNKLCYDTTGKGKLCVNASETSNLEKAMKDKVYEFVKNNYLDKEISYSVKSDREKDASGTIVKIKAEAVNVSGGGVDKEKILVSATATTLENITDASSKVYDEQKVTAVVDICAANLNNEIREYYALNSCSSELLDSPLISFSDVVIDGSTLDITGGDMLVKGTKRESEESTVADIDQTGGVIVQNGGTLNVATNLYCMSNVVGTNGWSKTDAADYAKETTINVDGDVIANTIGIFSDYYDNSANQLPYSHIGEKIKINIGKCAITDNDVMIGRWTKDCLIDVKGTIFGLSGEKNDDTKKIKMIVDGEERHVIDPNSSSGVFCQGEGSSKIKADRMIVAGQPFVVLAKNTLPLPLYESVGEPFEGVESIPEYASRDINNIIKDGAKEKLYLAADSVMRPLVKADKIETKIGKSAVVTTMSCINTDVEGSPTPEIGVPARSVFDTDLALWKFLFYLGPGSGDKTLLNLVKDTLPGKEAYNDPQNYIIDNAKTEAYYTGVATGDYSKLYGKSYGTVDDDVRSHYYGLKAYATAMRSVFYGKFGASANLSTLSFDEAVRNIGGLETHPWSYDTPILVCDGGEVNISKFYVKDDYDQLDFDGDGTADSGAGCYPTIIINRGTSTLTVYSDEPTQNTFNGLIISKGDVQLGKGGTLNINGSVIVGGKTMATTPTNEDIYKDHNTVGVTINGTVKINNVNKMLFNVEAKDRVLYRQVLDCLKLTKYKGFNADFSEGALQSNITDIMSAYSDSKVAYTASKLSYTNKSYLEMDTSQIYLKIVSEKKKD